MVGESFHHMVAGVRTVTIFRKGATAQKLWRLFAFGRRSSPAFTAEQGETSEKLVFRALAPPSVENTSRL